MSLLRPHRWTIDEYRSLDKTGLFHHVKTMLIHGEIYILPDEGPAHDCSRCLTDEIIRSTFKCRDDVHIRNRVSLDIGTHNDPSPDVAVVSGAIRDYTTKNPSTAVMIVEASVVSLEMDTKTKAELYALAGVPEYWILDVLGRVLHTYRDPVARPEGLGADAYRTRQVFGPNETVSPMAVPSGAVEVADLLP